MKKLVIVGLVVAVLVVMALAVTRPGAGSARASDPPDAVRALGDLLPRRQVSSAEMAGQPCWSGGEIIVASGQVCASRLPSRATQLTVCLVEGAVGTISVRGSDYGAQSSEQVPACGEGQIRFDLYDRNSQLAVACAPFTSCRLQLT